MRYLTLILFCAAAIAQPEGQGLVRDSAAPLGWKVGPVATAIADGSGAPANPCSALGSRYVQTDAAAGQNLWVCVSGSWVQQVGQGGGGGLPAGAIILIVAGSCPAGYTEATELNGKTILGTLTANGDVGTTGGADTITPAGTNAWPAGVPTNSGGAVDAHSGTAVGDHASHTHTYTDVVNHVHVQTAHTAATGPNVGYGVDASTNTATASGYSTANPTGGVASGTTAGPSAVLTHAVTQPSNHIFTQPTIAWPAGVPAFTGTQFDNRSAWIKVIPCKKT